MSLVDAGVRRISSHDDQAQPVNCTVRYEASLQT